MKKMFIASIVAAADYVGQEFTPRVIMEIETAGVIDSQYYTIM